MPKLVTATLVKNEAARFFRSALSAWSQFSDKIVVLDDGSTDETPLIAKAAGAVVVRRNGAAAWGDEAPARQQLFDLAISESEPGDYIAILDADMTFARDPRELCFNGTSTEWAFPLYDLWSRDRYRWDGFWCGHLHPRVWLFRRPLARDWTWPAKGIHCGHLPVNYHIGHLGIAPAEYGLLHFAYSSPELRQAKYAQYMSVKAQLSPGELAHAKSIIDPNPATYPLPFRPDFQLYLEPTMDEAA